MSDERTRLPAPETQLVEQALALADPDGYLIMLGQVMTEQPAIPKILLVAEFARRAAKISVKLPTLSLVEKTWSSRTGRFLQTRETARLKASNPVFHGSRTLAEKLGHMVTALSGEHEQYSVEAVVIPRLLGAQYLLPDGNFHDLGIFDFQFAHGFLLSASSITERGNMRNYLRRYV
jgi:hypothetical protein